MDIFVFEGTARIPPEKAHHSFQVYVIHERRPGGSQVWIQSPDSGTPSKFERRVWIV